MSRLQSQHDKIEMMPPTTEECRKRDTKCNNETIDQKDQFCNRSKEAPLNFHSFSHDEIDVNKTHSNRGIKDEYDYTRTGAESSTNAKNILSSPKLIHDLSKKSTIDLYRKRNVKKYETLYYLNKFNYFSFNTHNIFEIFKLQQFSI